MTSSTGHRCASALLLAALLCFPEAPMVCAHNSTSVPLARCVPAVQCPTAMLRAHRTRVTVCALPSGVPGVLCQPKQQRGPAGHARALLRETRPGQLRMAAAAAERSLARMLKAAESAPALGRDSPSFAHFHSVLPAHPLELRAGDASPAGAQHRDALRSVLTAQELARRRGWGPRDLLDDMDDDEEADNGPRSEGPACPPPPECSAQDLIYRRPDGACNNPLHPRWGAANTPHSRTLPPRYHDGMWQPRRSVLGGPLPGARRLSTVVFPDHDAPHHYASLLVVLFGQVISHDVLLTPSIELRNGSGVQCCSADETTPLPPELRHFACMPIEIPPDDPFYARFGKRCLNFVRSQLALRDDCQLGPAAQLNKVTHFVDASPVYGNSPAVAGSTRELRGGRLRAHFEMGRQLLPLSDDPPTCAAVRAPHSCFFTGDVRTNQMVGLVAVGQLLLRHHNALADALHVVNPHWDDERLYQEARRIVCAQLQHVLYSEWLPVVVGRVAMADYGLWPLLQGYSDGYDPQVDPSTTIEFATAAFRFGHSTVDGLIKLLHKGVGMEHVFLPEVVFNPSRLHDLPFFDEFFNSMTREPMQRADHFVTQALTNYLFNDDKPFGVDLVAINIQRGLDHGMPTYDDMRVLQGLPPARSFHNFHDRIPWQGISLLEKMYASPQDVDFFVGGLLEMPAYDAVVGPSFQGIIADQFSRLKRGDRFFYEFGGQPNSFTAVQLQELRKTRFARLLCDMTDGLDFHRVSLQPFLLPSVPGNEPIDCLRLPLPRIDLRHWKDS